ncbi:phosphatase/kinase [Moumouvirus australiensis]|uniref:Phosphatase/kinase n=1 Tax=Moumouvirus australiensis TaxID=2109587 RepID=A0A2P1ELH7_9VIRU|nr:phosphatase/kinase [Moumouvirus australiensis]AVL94732.1 phosphatase/kinase [Moumouvirus australiensis]
MNWLETNSYLKGIINNLHDLHDPVRVAGFDLDDTLICKSKDKNKKWRLLDSSIKNKISELVDNKYIIIIFTNQGGMSLNKNFDKISWRKAVEDLIKIFISNLNTDKYYFAIYTAKTYDIYRKPNTGLWNLMKNDLKDEFNIDKINISNKSFFCGDAAGRITPSFFKKKINPSSNKGDFSDTDRKFAINIGIDFLTPEEFLLENSDNSEYKLEGIIPNEFLKKQKFKKYYFEPRKKEMIMLIGPPGSGKSYFATKYILPHNYIYINRDTCKTKIKCFNETKKALTENKSVVIDNTNPDVLSRMEYTSLAKDFGYKNIRAIIINTDEKLYKHLNNVRHIYSEGKIPKVSDIAYRIYKNKYISPQKTEGFDTIETIDFVIENDNFNDPKWFNAFNKLSEYK